MAATRLRGCVSMSLFGLLCACAGQPYSNEEASDLPQFGPKRVITPPAQPAKVAVPAQASAREKLAAIYLEQGRYADALVQWKILATVHPGEARYEKQIDQIEEQIDKLAAQRQRAGIAALDKGDTATARHELLAALALDPARIEILDYLRRIEYDRVWRIQSAKLEKLKTSEDRKAPNVGEQERSYFELGTLMLREGDYTGAVREIQKYLNSYPGDPQAKKLISDAYAKLAAQQRQQGMLHNALANVEQAKRFNTNATTSKAEHDLRSALADEYYEKGMRALRTDLKVAMEMFNKALEYQPQHAKARAKLADAQRMHKKLEEIGK